MDYYTDENGKGTSMVNATEEQFRCMTTHGKMSLEDMARRIGICDVFCYPRVPKEFTMPRKVCKPDNARLFQAWVEEEVQELQKRRDAIVWNSPPIFLACAGNTAKYNSCYTDPGKEPTLLLNVITDHPCGSIHWPAGPPGPRLTYEFALPRAEGNDDGFSAIGAHLSHDPGFHSEYFYDKLHGKRG
ncbi:hypothetical protein B484DRAFT_400715, partial [Ochromonadaceae sp. CCMP2298]